ncbi:OadG family protein [bacterium]|nr:OadG family protein [bacterium]
MVYEGLIIMVVGVIVVFSFLALIVVLIQMTSFLVQKWTKETKKTTEELPPSIIAGIIALAHQRHLNSR